MEFPLNLYGIGPGMVEFESSTLFYKYMTKGS